MGQVMAHVVADGATVQRGNRIPAQGVGGFDQNWYPLCLSSEVNPGGVLGCEFLNGRVVVFRRSGGELTVASAYCRHLGADLGGGEMVGDELRCPYHHWQYDGAGACVKIATGDKPPASARLFKFPSREAFGVVWAFNGEKPLFDLPRFSEYAEEELVWSASRESTLPVDPYVIFSNTMDIQHLRSVHGMTVEFDPDGVSQSDYSIEYRSPMVVPGLGPMNQHVTLWGTNTITLAAEIMGRPLLQMASGCALPGGRTVTFSITASPKGSGTPEENEQIEALIAMGAAFGRQLIEEDSPVFNAMRFSQDVLTASDRGLSIYLNHARRFPRANPAGDLIT